MPLATLYRIQEFAALAGVTVKALRHYDRLGLLTPRRSGSGYRVYADRDLVRLQQILALKRLGFSLGQIETILDRTSGDLPGTLREQRKVIEAERDRLDRAIKALRTAEEAIDRGTPVDPALLERIVEVIEMQDDIEAMKKYYSEEGWKKHRRFYEEGPSPEWQALYRDVNQLLEEDPGSDQAQDVAARWLALSIRAGLGDPDVQTHSMTAWLDRQHWPEVMKQRIAAFNLEAVYDFIRRAALCSGKQYFTEDAWAVVCELRKRSAEEVSRKWQSRVNLFRDVERALGDDPAGERAQSLAARWVAQVDDSSSGNVEVREGLLRQWADRSRWSPLLRWRAEGLYMMSFDRFERAAQFIDDAVGARR